MGRMIERKREAEGPERKQKSRIFLWIFETPHLEGITGAYRALNKLTRPPSAGAGSRIYTSTTDIHNPPNFPPGPLFAPTPFIYPFHPCLPPPITMPDGSYVHPQERQFNPYTENGGTILAIAGADFSVIAGDTRQSEGYSIQTRYAPKVFRLYVHS